MLLAMSIGSCVQHFRMTYPLINIHHKCGIAGGDELHYHIQLYLGLVMVWAMVWHTIGYGMVH